jgi:hypothetical protein
MKLVNQSVEYNMWDTNLKFFNFADILPSIDLNMNRKYGIRSEVADSNLKFRLQLINTLIGNVKGKTILDLGSGAKKSWDYTWFSETPEKERYYDPWLCRALHELGANTIGIDGGESPGEEFKYYQQNLRSSGKLLDSFDDNSIDLTCAFSLFDSPSLYGDGKELFNFFVKKLENKIK